MVAVFASLQFIFIVLSIIFFNGVSAEDQSSKRFPLVISTWAFKEAVIAAWEAANHGSSAVDAVVEGCSACEELRCDGTVGPGGSPNEEGETTLDALVMNGETMEVGAVAAMRNVKDGIKAARLVMQHTMHTLLVGEKASSFAISMGLPGPTDISSPESIEKWNNWKQNKCQPNFRKNVSPLNKCGPYEPPDVHKCFPSLIDKQPIRIGAGNHDTISMAVLDQKGHIAVGTSSNGATFKIPGRAGDGAVVGSGAYADDEIGGCGATGDGDIMMRFLPCYQVVESMRLGMSPKEASENAIKRIVKKYRGFVGAVFAVDRNGVHAAACNGWTFQYSVRTPLSDDVHIFTVFPSVNYF